MLMEGCAWHDLRPVLEFLPVILADMHFIHMYAYSGSGSAQTVTATNSIIKTDAEYVGQGCS